MSDSLVVQVQWNSFMDKSVPDPPTCVLLHGILGSRKNWGELNLFWYYTRVSWSVCLLLNYHLFQLSLT